MNESPKLPFSFELLTDVYHLKTELIYYDQFYGEVELLFKKNDELLQKEIERKLDEIPEKDHDEFIDSYGFELHQNQLMFPSMHRESIFISLYNNLEHSLNRICNKIGEELNSNIRLKHLHGSGIERALLFLKKIPEFDFTSINETIAFIKNTNRLRNVVVHNGANLPESPTDKLNQFISTQESLSGLPSGSVRFKEKFIPTYIENLKRFFIHIEDEMQRFLDKYRT